MVYLAFDNPINKPPSTMINPKNSLKYLSLFAAFTVGIIVGGLVSVIILNSYTKISDKSYGSGNSGQSLGHESDTTDALESLEDDVFNLTEYADEYFYPTYKHAEEILEDFDGDDYYVPDSIKNRYEDREADLGDNHQQDHIPASPEISQVDLHNVSDLIRAPEFLTKKERSRRSPLLVMGDYGGDLVIDDNGERGAIAKNTDQAVDLRARRSTRKRGGVEDQVAQVTPRSSDPETGIGNSIGNGKRRRRKRRGSGDTDSGVPHPKRITMYVEVETGKVASIEATDDLDDTVSSRPHRIGKRSVPKARHDPRHTSVGKEGGSKPAKQRAVRRGRNSHKGRTPKRVVHRSTNQGKSKTKNNPSHMNHGSEVGTRSVNKNVALKKRGLKPRPIKSPNSNAHHKSISKGKVKKREPSVNSKGPRRLPGTRPLRKTKSSSWNRTQRGAKARSLYGLAIDLSRKKHDHFYGFRALLKNRYKYGYPKTVGPKKGTTTTKPISSDTSKGPPNPTDAGVPSMAPGSPSPIDGEIAGKPIDPSSSVASIADTYGGLSQNLKYGNSVAKAAGMVAGIAGVMAGIALGKEGITTREAFYANTSQTLPNVSTFDQTGPASFGPTLDTTASGIVPSGVVITQGITRQIIYNTEGLKTTYNDLKGEMFSSGPFIPKTSENLIYTSGTSGALDLSQGTETTQFNDQISTDNLPYKSEGGTHTSSSIRQQDTTHIDAMGETPQSYFSTQQTDMNLPSTSYTPASQSTSDSYMSTTSRQPYIPTYSESSSFYINTESNAIYTGTSTPVQGRESTSDETSSEYTASTITDYDTVSVSSYAPLTGTHEYNVKEIHVSNDRFTHGESHSFQQTTILSQAPALSTEDVTDGYQYGVDTNPSETSRNTASTYTTEGRTTTSQFSPSSPSISSSVYEPVYSSESQTAQHTGENSQTYTTSIPEISTGRRQYTTSELIPSPTPTNVYQESTEPSTAQTFEPTESLSGYDYQGTSHSQADLNSHTESVSQTSLAPNAYTTSTGVTESTYSPSSESTSMSESTAFYIQETIATGHTVLNNSAEASVLPDIVTRYPSTFSTSDIVTDSSVSTTGNEQTNRPSLSVTETLPPYIPADTTASKHYDDSEHRKDYLPYYQTAEAYYVSNKDGPRYTEARPRYENSQYKYHSDLTFLDRRKGYNRFTGPYGYNNFESGAGTEQTSAYSIQEHPSSTLSQALKNTETFSPNFQFTFGNYNKRDSTGSSTQKLQSFNENYATDEYGKDGKGNTNLLEPTLPYLYYPGGDLGEAARENADPQTFMTFDDKSNSKDLNRIDSYNSVGYNNRNLKFSRYPFNSKSHPGLLSSPNNNDLDGEYPDFSIDPEEFDEQQRRDIKELSNLNNVPEYLEVTTTKKEMLEIQRCHCKSFNPEDTGVYYQCRYDPTRSKRTLMAMDCHLSELPANIIFPKDCSNQKV